MGKNYVHHVPGEPIGINTDRIAVNGHTGTWYVIAAALHCGKQAFLLEHEEYGDDVSGVVVDSEGSLLCEDVYDDFPECLEYSEDFDLSF